MNLKIHHNNSHPMCCGGQHVSRTERNLIAASGTLRVCFTSLLGLGISNDQVSLHLLTGQMKQREASHCHLLRDQSDQTKSCFQIPPLESRAAEVSYFWFAVQCNIQVDKKGILTTGSVSSTKSCRKATASSTPNMQNCFLAHKVN